MKKEPKFSSYLIPALCVVALIWVLWIVEHYTGVRLIRKFTRRIDDLPILVPMVLSPVILIVSYILFRRASGIVANGENAVARIVKLGKILSGMQDVELAYSFEGTEYKCKKSLSQLLFEDKAPGDEIEIVIDSRNPKKIHIE